MSLRTFETTARKSDDVGHAFVHKVVSGHEAVVCARNEQ